jgi:hypothetical protein
MPIRRNLNGDSEEWIPIPANSPTHDLDIGNNETIIKNPMKNRGKKRVRCMLISF